MAAGSHESQVELTPHVLRAQMREHALWPEDQAVNRLLRAMALTVGARHRAIAVAMTLVEGARARRDERPFLDAFLQEFALSNQEGIALMCIAEALLRIPDDATADRLIAEQLASGDWAAHAGKSESLFVNASTWGLMLTGGILELDPTIKADAPAWVRKLTRKAGEPLVRLAVRRAMRIIGSEFVFGRTIEEALERSAREAELRLCSFDVLGEGARTLKDAERYFESYVRAIEVTGAGAGQRPRERSSISIKLSALEPRYAPLQHERVMRRLVPKVLILARLAAKYGIQLTIDAEEADRLDLSLDVIEMLARDTATRSWDGLGLAVQAYSKRALDVIDWVAATARSSGRRMTVRLVKGAYWDSEIKRGQERGLEGYPVYTRKVTTDVSYLACAGRLFNYLDVIFPQFATHNAHSIASILELAPVGSQYEFQRLHGMGRLLYAEATRQIEKFPQIRVYAPVGEHKDLLAYLVRRLLENGANTSFVNRFMDEHVAVADIVRDPIAELERLDAYPHPRLQNPVALYANRRNSVGVDVGNPLALAAVQARLASAASSEHAAGPIINGELLQGRGQAVRNPADHRDQVGTSRDATPMEITHAFDAGRAAQAAWNDQGGAARADRLERAAALLETNRLDFYELLVREAGKTVPDAIAEVREAEDFCRYYAMCAREQFADPARLEGPTGESNELSLHGRGVFACISPWNFPLAIFAGQVTAALAAGNCVVAKPAESTPLIAARFIRLLHEAGVPPETVHMVPAVGRVFGEVALAHPALAGVAMTGSTATAITINRALAARGGAIVPLIAETGGLNAMLVDSTALLEQVVDDVMSSAFSSAGQRCSALRLLFLQDEISDTAIDMIVGAMEELVIGDPAHLETDVGPVITGAAADGLNRHIARMHREARIIKACCLEQMHTHGSFVAPVLIELSSASQLTREEFGPILHVVRFRSDEIQNVLAAIRATHYGLTLGVETRLESFWQQVFAGTSVGNTYVNRNMIGAVVGVQPFGGTGLSGTGPKAGGPHYLTRFATERTLTMNTAATGGNAALLNLGA
jgi:RHH-type proline utilization regulon transcriptional repressor/proline dehydrogenase/delta 1-pyrroline-5-carboxylate dehydrogenase